MPETVRAINLSGDSARPDRCRTIRRAGRRSRRSRLSPNATRARRAAVAGFPIRFAYQNAPWRSWAAPARRPASADRAAARLAAGSMPARARSSSTQPIPAAPLSSPTWTGTVASPGSSAQADPAIAADRSHVAARRATSRYWRSPVVSYARRLTHAIPAAPSSNPAGVGGAAVTDRPVQPARRRR